MSKQASGQSGEGSGFPPGGIKPYSKQELCALYNVSRKVLKSWFLPFETELGKINGKIYTVVQVQVIFNNIGMPFKIEEE